MSTETRTELDLDAISSDLDEVRANVAHAEAQHNPHALTALHAADALIAEVRRLRAEMADGNRIHRNTVTELDKLRAELAQIADAVAPTVTITPTVGAVRFLHSLYTDWVATAHERLAKVDEQAAEIERLRAELAAERKTADELRDDLRVSDQQYADLQQSLAEARNAVE